MSDALEQRLRALEERLAQVEQGVCEVREIRIVDDAGRVRGVLGATGGGGPTLIFRNEAGADRAKLTVGADGPGLTLADEEGHTRAWLGFSKEALRIGFADEHGNNRAFFGVMRKAGPVVKFYDEQQRVVWSAPGEDEPGPA